MTEPPPTLPDRFAPATDPIERRQLWLQFIIVLSIAVVPDVVYAIDSFFSMRPSYEYSMMSLGAVHTSRSLWVIAACISCLFLGNSSLHSIGLGRFNKVDLGLTLFVLGLTLGAHAALGNLVYDTFGDPKSTILPRPQSIMDWYWFLLMHLANGTAEELAIWGLLYTRLRRLWHTREWPSLLIPAVAFATYHIYQGVSPAILVLIGGLIHGLMYRVTGRLWPLILAHAASNIWFAS